MNSEVLGVDAITYKIAEWVLGGGYPYDYLVVSIGYCFVVDTVFLKVYNEGDQGS